MKTWIEISKSNLLHNVREITKRLDPKTRFMAVIKSNAYGHGAEEIVRILLENTNEVTPPSLPLDKGRKGGVETVKNELWFGVDSIWEARTLTSPTVQTVGLPPILVLGYTPREELKNIPENVRLTIGSLEALQDAARSVKHLKIHLKIETGTTRQGIQASALNAVVRILKNSKLILEGVSSHFAEAEIQPTTLFTEQQLKKFYDASEFLSQLGYKNLIRHIACSAAASHMRESRFDMIRAGINLYGLSSIDRHREERSDVAISGIAALHSQPSGLPRSAVAELAMTEHLLNLKPVLTWKTTVAQIKNVKRGETIGYGRLVRMPYDGQIAILPIGYWDGYDRQLSDINRNREVNDRGDLAFPSGGLSRPTHACGGLAMTGNGGEVLIGGKRCPIIGRVCMNMCMALLPKNLHAKMGDEVVLIGKQGDAEVTADEVAQKIGTINYEVVTRINPLIQRVISH